MYLFGEATSSPRGSTLHVYGPFERWYGPLEFLSAQSRGSGRPGFPGPVAGSARSARLKKKVWAAGVIVKAMG